MEPPPVGAPDEPLTVQLAVDLLRLLYGDATSSGPGPAIRVVRASTAQCARSVAGG